MERSEKLVEAGLIALRSWTEERLKDFASEIMHYDRLPESEEELIKWIEDADAVLVRILTILPLSVLFIYV